MVEETKTEKEFVAPGLEELMELISFPRWEIKEHPTLGMHGLRIPDTKIFLAVPGRRELLEALRDAHEAELGSYRKRLFALLMLFESSGEDFARFERVPEEERAAFVEWADTLFGHMGMVARKIVLDGERIIDDVLAKRNKEGGDA